MTDNKQQDQGQQEQGGNTVRGAVEKATTEPRSVQVARQYQPQFADILPEHVDAKAFVGAAIATLRRDPELLKAAEASTSAFVVALSQCASLGHVPSGKEFYLTPRREKYKDTNGRDAWRTVILGMEGYRGVIERMYRSGAVASVKVREVCEQDRFVFVDGDQDRPLHEVDWFSDRPRDPSTIIGAYAYAELTTGAVSRVVVLSKKDLDDAKAASDLGAKDKGPWSDNPHGAYRAMVLKTAAHRLEPWVPTSAEFRREQLRAQAQAGDLTSRVDMNTGEILPDADDGVVDGEVVE